MKKLFIALCAGLLAAANLCAVVLPDGQNVRADEVTTYDSGAIESVTLRNDTDITTPGGVVRAAAGAPVYYYENGTPSTINPVYGAAITTPIGSIPAAGAIFFYENGTVKSVEADADNINSRLTIQTNFGPISNFNNDVYGYVRVTFTFYESGSLWYIDGYRSYADDGSVSRGILPATNLRTPNGDFTLSGHMLFYDAGGADTQIVHKANLASKQSATVTTKAATFSLKGTSSIMFSYYDDYGNLILPRVEMLRYGMDDFSISFYKNGNIEKIFIDEDTAKDMSVQTSLGELFVRGNALPLMFWEDGSIKQCVTDDVLQATVYGKNATIPVGVLLRFRRDGSVWAYTTTSENQFTVGRTTYKTEDNDTLVLDEAGNVVQCLSMKYREVSRFKWATPDSIGLELTSPSYLKFYDSGAVKKSRSPYIDMDGQEDINNVLWWNENEGVSFMYENALYYRPDANNSREQYTAKLECRDFLVDMVYFADNGYPISYDVLKTTVDVNDGWRTFRLPDHLFIEMTEDSEFVIDRRVRGVQFTRQ